MAKVFGFGPVGLRAGVSGDAFERFWPNEHAPIGLRVDWNARLWKADRGQRTGKYMVAMSARFQDFLIRWNWTDYMRIEG